MATETDLRIFVCGVTQYAMSSGKFEADDIIRLSERARDAFVALFGPVSPDAHPAQRPSPGAAQRDLAPSSAQDAIEPETKPFSMWGGDKAYFGKTSDQAYGMPIRDVEWGTWLHEAMNGDAKARQVLEIMAKGTVGDDPKWKRANATKIARARACLGMLKAWPAAAPLNDGGPPDTTPF